ncbi:phage portal protein, lambda family [Thalassovita gelatinovora]|uniref:Phage portal protein, lambda family n=1 Tax=Thalassovita gelatinovora TaxID=53501 RepID=A0A0P1FFR6_THAGE|nr:phage portal protein [Thalassovita gelatinovora]QIZ79785.1 phage portal protein [Thalassovita gelatinovora]CUH66821.1 phage portal protein, lambda family [Thalassovita gelatinovora]SEQ43384.1 phage portal protein, lambda family [Thalassovita gelatinovora]
MTHFQTANVLDRAILAVSPRRGLDRIEAKTRARILMNYDGASRGRRLKGWKAPGTDADAASLQGRARLRQLSRDMHRNSPFAVRARAVVTNNVVATGIKPSIVAGNKRAKAAAEKVILGHLKSKRLDKYGEHDLFSQQALVQNSVFESGEVLVLRHDRPAAAGLDLPFQTEIVEIDQLDPTVMTGPTGNEVIDGLEYDAEGNVVAFHIYEQHPGSASRKISLKSHRWPAERVLHIRRLDRPGQTRGVPWLAPVMVTLGELRDYQEAQILKQKISSLLVGVVTSTQGTPLTEAQKKAGLGSMSPGGITYLEDGQKMEWSDPPSVGEYDVVMRLGLLAISMGLGITYESLAGDLSRVNFASSKVGRIEMDANVAAWQTHMMIGQFCEGIAKWALDAYRLTRAAMRGISINWTAPKRPMIDPAKEIKPEVQKIERGLTSRQRSIRGMGQDPDVIDREIEEDEVRDAERAARVLARTKTTQPKGDGDEGTKPDQ